jgi:hypothetical protein
VVRASFVAAFSLIRHIAVTCLRLYAGRRNWLAERYLYAKRAGEGLNGDGTGFTFSGKGADIRI